MIGKLEALDSTCCMLDQTEHPFLMLDLLHPSQQENKMFGSSLSKSVTLGEVLV